MRFPNSHQHMNRMRIEYHSGKKKPFLSTQKGFFLVTYQVQEVEDSNNDVVFMYDWVVLPELGLEPSPRKKKALGTVLKGFASLGLHSLDKTRTIQRGTGRPILPGHYLPTARTLCALLHDELQLNRL